MPVRRAINSLLLSLAPLLTLCRRRLLRRLLASMPGSRAAACGWRRVCLAIAVTATLLAAALTAASPAPTAAVVKAPPLGAAIEAGTPTRLSLSTSAAPPALPSRNASSASAPLPQKAPFGHQQQRLLPSAQTQQFLSHLAGDSSNSEELLAALRTKLPLLNRISELGADRTLLERAKSCSATSRLTLKHVQNFSYLHNEPHMCTGQLLMIAAVHSNAKNLNRRATIRRTWGSLRYVGANRLQLVFFLGRQDSRSVQREIDEESRRYRDLVQVDFREHYRNMSYKHLSIYEWVLAHCSGAQYLLKVDDDTFADVVHLVTFLQHSPPEGFYCSNTRGAKPQRLKRGPKAKWAVSRAEFSGVRYPPYCEGFGYAVRTSHLADLFVCSLFHKFFWIDDVYVTGVLPAAAKVPLTEFWNGHGYTGQLPSMASEKILDYIFLVADHNEFLEVVWYRLWRSVLQYSLDLTL